MAIKIAKFAAQGQRDYMEDAEFHKDTPKYFISAVFDGHAGKQTSMFLARHFGIVFDHYFQKNLGINHCICMTLAKLQTFIVVRRELFGDSGSTCNVVVIHKEKDMVYCANVGDSRTIAYFKNGTTKALSNDHKPTDPQERKNIEKKGGFVANDRVCGILAMSRAMGDFSLCKYISCIPTVTKTQWSKIEYIVQASDGLFDVYCNREITAKINTVMGITKSMGTVVRSIGNHTLNNTNCTDNVTILLITR